MVKKDQIEILLKKNLKASQYLQLKEKGLGINNEGDLIKGLDSLEYFEITNLGRIGARKREPLSKQK
jgi:hypothetical protein